MRDFYAVIIWTMTTCCAFKNFTTYIIHLEHMYLETYCNKRDESFCVCLGKAPTKL